MRWWSVVAAAWVLVIGSASVSCASFVWTHPLNQETNDYERAPWVAWLAGSVTVRGKFVNGEFGAPARLVLWMGATHAATPITGFAEPAFGIYSFTVDTTTLPDGHGMIGIERQTYGPPSDGYVLPVVIRNRSTTPPAPESAIVRVTRFDRELMGIRHGVARIDLPTPLVMSPTPIRSVESVPRSTLPASPTEILSIPLGIRMQGHQRELVAHPSGVPVVGEFQQYFHHDQAKGAFGPLRDGGRGVAWSGYSADLIVPGNGKAGVIGISTNGNLWQRRWDGSGVTLAGWRLKPGRLTPHYRVYDTHPTWFHEHYENVGRWINGTGRLVEPWAVREDPGDVHVYYLTNTKGGADGRGEIVQADVNPWKLPQGVTELRRVYAGPKVAWPWGIEVVTLAGTEWLYWTNFLDGTLVRANLTKWKRHRDVPLTDADVEVVFRTRRAATWFDVRRTNQFALPSLPSGSPAAIRARLAAEGPLDGPYGMLVFPQHVRKRADGHTLIIGEPYTTRLVSFDAANPSAGVKTYFTFTHLEATRDIGLTVDTEGECGPKDRAIAVFWMQGGAASVVPSAADPTVGVRRAWHIPGYADDVALPAAIAANDSGNPLVFADGSAITNVQYETSITCGDGRLLVYGTGQYDDLAMVVSRPTWWRLRDWAKFERGQSLYRRTLTTAGAPLAILYGPRGMNWLGLPQLAEIARYPAEERRAFWQSHFASPLSASLLDDLDYFATWLVYPLPDVDPLDIQISAPSVASGTVNITLTSSGGSAGALRKYTLVVDGVHQRPVYSTALTVTIPWDTRTVENGLATIMGHVGDGVVTERTDHAVVQVAN